MKNILTVLLISALLFTNTYAQNAVNYKTNETNISITKKAKQNITKTKKNKKITKTKKITTTKKTTNKKQKVKSTSNNSQGKIKGNINSKGEKIYHVPGGVFYEKTIAEEYFDTEEQAQAAGYRASKR